MQKMWFVALFVFGFYAFASRAAGFEVSAALFCSNPIQAICGSSNAAASAREARLKSRVAQMEYEAFIHALVELKQGAMSFSMADLKKLDADTQYRVYYSYLFGSVLKADTFLAEENGIWRNVDQIKTLLKNAVARVYPGTLAGPYALTRLKLMNEINKTIILDSRMISKRVANNEEDANELKQSYVQGCGDSGLGDNAFAHFSAKSLKKYLIVCPGFMIAAKGAGSQARASFRNLLQVLAHEWGHHFDVAWYPVLYENYADCLLQHHAQDLTDPAYDKNGKPTVEALLSSTSETRLRTLRSHLREITADYWAAETVLQSFSMLSTTSDKIEVLQESYNFMCGSGDEGIHPSGDYRIGVVLGRHAGMRAAMNCEPLLLACSLKEF